VRRVGKPILALTLAAAVAALAYVAASGPSYVVLTGEDLARLLDMSRHYEPGDPAKLSNVTVVLGCGGEGLQYCGDSLVYAVAGKRVEIGLDGAWRTWLANSPGEGVTVLFVRYGTTNYKLDILNQPGNYLWVYGGEWEVRDNIALLNWGDQYFSLWGVLIHVNASTCLTVQVAFDSDDDAAIWVDGMLVTAWLGEHGFNGAPDDDRYQPAIFRTGAGDFQLSGSSIRLCPGWHIITAMQHEYGGGDGIYAWLIMYIDGQWRTYLIGKELLSSGVVDRVVAPPPELVLGWFIR